MTWQFYGEVFPDAVQGKPLIERVLQCNWEPKRPSTCIMRCGTNWKKANSLCGSCCISDADCGGSRCYANLSSAPCDKSYVLPTTTEYYSPPTTTNNTVRCSANWNVYLVIVILMMYHVKLV